jgi:predicted MFS family arabinose efflux permease
MPWRLVVAAAAALLIGIGLARFAYAPLLPAVIAQGWFAPEAAAYLGAANLLGYLAGSITAPALARRIGGRAALRGAMLLATVSLAACSSPMPFAWFFIWRLLSGIVGGLIMILAPSMALAQVPTSRRGLAGGVIVTGVGLGIAASGMLVPLVIRWGLTQAWLGLALVALALAIFSWGAWPTATPTSAVSGTARRFGSICLSYGLCGVGLGPHMVFLVDFVARGLGRGLDAGSLAWVLFGVGALCGPIAVGRIVDRFGAERAFRLVVVAEAAAVALLLFPSSAANLNASALLGGLVASGITAAMLGRIGMRAGNDQTARQHGWTQATIAWAIGQAAGTYGMAWLYGRTGDYRVLFAASLAALAGVMIAEMFISAAHAHQTA